MSQDQLFMMNVQNQCCQFFILIKRVHVFYKGWLVFFATRGGVFLCTIGKTTIGKNKN